jgi:hypothetical protein
MGPMPDDELEQIIEHDAPGYTLARPRGPDDEAAGRERGVSAEPEETSPDIDALRRKYLGDDADAAEADVGALDDESDDEIVAVRPANPSDPFDQPARPKTVVVSGKDKRIVGQQG